MNNALNNEPLICCPAQADSRAIENQTAIVGDEQNNYTTETAIPTPMYTPSLTSEKDSLGRNDTTLSRDLLGNSDDIDVGVLARQSNYKNLFMISIILTLEKLKSIAHMGTACVVCEKFVF